MSKRSDPKNDLTPNPSPRAERGEEPLLPAEVGAPSEGEGKAGKDAGAPRKPLPAETGPAVTYDSCRERIAVASERSKKREEELRAKPRGK